MSEGAGDADQGQAGAAGGSGEQAGDVSGGPKAGQTPASERGAEGEGSALAGALAAKPEGPGEPKANPKEGDEPKKDVAPPAADPKDAAPKDVDGNAVPEKYEIKMPDGIEMNQELLAEVTPLFKEAKLSPAQAQVVADAYMKTQRDAMDAHLKQVEGWRKQAKSDPEVGGKDYDKHLADAHKGFKAFGDREALTIMDNYGLGDHPAILRLFSRVGKAIGEGSTILTGDGGAQVSDGRALYPDMHKN